MRYQVHQNQVHVSQSLASVIEKKVDKIKERLKRYHPDVADLDIRLNQMDDGNSFECNLVLNAFRDTLHAKKSAPELRVAVDRSFEAMLKELEAYRSKINKSLNH